MEIVTTHVGADFDAFASVLVARRLHPEAKAFFPGSPEESVRRLVETGLVTPDEVRQRQVDPSHLERVVLCDCRRRDRLGVVGEWLADNPGVEVLAYDHHEPSSADVQIAGGVVDPAVGATATLLIELLRARGEAVAPWEATLLLLGIYEDTWALTSTGTSARDLEAAAWLLAQGGELAAVRRFALPSLDPGRLELLHRMSEALEVHVVHGHRVGLVALELGEYVEELAPLVSRCARIFDLPLLFAVLGEGDGAAIIARGEVPGLDLGEVLEAFGGGGHSTAAAGRVRGVTPLELRETLLAHLERVLPPAARAADLMVRDFARLPAGTPVAVAKEQINAHRVNAAPVMDGDGRRVIGAVTRHVLDAALQHGLGKRPVEAVMTAELEWIEPGAPADEVGRRILARHPRFVLVGDAASEIAEGLVTRMAVLRHLHGSRGKPEVERRTWHLRERSQKVAHLLAHRVAPEVLAKILAAARAGQAAEMPVYLVGGFVRDLLLGRENRDLDLVVEGDGLRYARLLAGELDGRVREHREFLTAVVIAADGSHIDVATARAEFYRAPAALPEVVTSALRQDLYRRDFTVNTLALRLYPGKEPEVIDFFGGLQDLEAGVLRVLHSLSFIDDPTRALRAVRLEQRLSFHLSPETLRLLRVALGEGVFARLSGARLRDELALLLRDPSTAVHGLERLEELGLLHVVQPELRLDPALKETLKGAVAAYDWYRVEGLEDPAADLSSLLLAALAASLRPDARRGLAGRLGLSGREWERLVEAPDRLARLPELLQAPDLSPHAAAEALAGLCGEDLLLLMTRGDAARAWVRRYLTDLRSFELRVAGGDLVARGVDPGPRIGRALKAVWRARIDGEIGEEEELEYALAAAGARGETP